MSSNLKRGLSRAKLKVLEPLLMLNMMNAATNGSPSYYSLFDSPTHSTTEEERLFVEKQGYKQPTQRDRYQQKLKRSQLRLRKNKGHKHGGAKR